MKIIHLAPVFTPYHAGMANVVVNQAEKLASRGHEVTVITPQYVSAWPKNEELRFKNYDLSAQNKESSVRVYRVTPLLYFGNGAFIPGMIGVLRKILRSRELGTQDDKVVIHVHSPFFGGQEIVWLLRYSNILKNVRIILQYHHDPQLSGITKLLGIPTKLIFTSLLKHVDRVIVSSIDYASESNISQLIDDRFVEIPFGVDIERFKSNDLRIKNNKPIILFVGALDRAHHFKGVETLLQATAKLQITHPPSEITEGTANYKLQIIGKGDLLDGYKKIAEQLGISDRVEFLGFVPDDELPTFHSQADIFVFPSTGKAEAFGLVALEAMSAGLPVIASNLPGVRSLFKDDQLLVAPGSVDELSEKIQLLLNDQALRATIGAQNRNRVLEKYTWEKSIDMLEKLYSHKA